MRLKELWQKKTLTEGLMPRTAKMDARESYGWNPLPILPFAQVLICYKGSLRCTAVDTAQNKTIKGV